MMDNQVILAIVKDRLNRRDTALDAYLIDRIEAAEDELSGTGIVLDDSTRDAMLVADTVVWDYSNRDKAAGMPDWLRLKRRERWLQQERTT